MRSSMHTRPIAPIVSMVAAAITILIALDGVLPVVVVSAQESSNTSTTQNTLLMEFYNATNGPSWHNNSGWGTRSDHCTWHGVRCVGDELQLYLNASNLVGTLPDSFGSIPLLSTIYLQSNFITGSLPTSVTTSSILRIIDIANNQLHGPLPALWGASIDTVSLSNNSFTGTLPGDWGACQRMYYMDLSYNALEGPLPVAWNRMIRLVTVDVGYNPLHATLPPEWGNMSVVRALRLANTSIYGTLPPSWQGIKTLTYLNALYNDLSGTLPTEWCGLSTVRELYLQSNRLSGTLPSTWSALMNLSSLVLSNNHFTGTLPPEWGSLRLSALDLQDNPQLSGTIPASWSSVFSSGGNIGTMSICRTGLCGEASELSGLFGSWFICMPPNTSAIGNDPSTLLAVATFNASFSCTARASTPAPTNAPAAVLGGCNASNPTIAYPCSSQDEFIVSTTSAIAAITATAVAVAALAGSGGAGDAQMLVAVLGSPCMCGAVSAASSPGVLSLALSPLSPLGDAWTVLGNCAIMIVAVVVHCAVVHVAAGGVKQRVPRTGVNSRLLDVGLGVWIDSGRYDLRRLRDAMQLYRFPGLSVRVAVLLLPGVVRGVGVLLGLDVDALSGTAIGVGIVAALA